jgi:hypothetical protein
VQNHEAEVHEGHAFNVSKRVRSPNKQPPEIPSIQIFSGYVSHNIAARWPFWGKHEVPEDYNCNEKDDDKVNGRSRTLFADRIKQEADLQVNLFLSAIKLGIYLARL